MEYLCNRDVSWDWGTLLDRMGKLSKQALASGFADATLKLQYELVSSPLLILVGVVVTVLLSALGILFAQKY